MYLSDQIECIFRYWYFVDDIHIPLFDTHNFDHNVTNADLSRFNNIHKDDCTSPIHLGEVTMYKEENINFKYAWIGSLYSPHKTKQLNT